MKCGVRVALGVAGGYFLGRTKKMKLALMLGGMAAGRQAGGPGELLNQGLKLLGSSPELARLTDQVRGRLLEAGKTAAVAVATHQIEVLTDRVGRRVESLGEVGVPRPRKGEEEAPAEEETAADSGTDETAEQEAPADEATAEDTGEPEEEADREPPAPRRPARARPATSAPGRGAGSRATATARRTASGAGGAGRAVRAAGESAGRRKPRTRRGEGDG